MSIERLLTHADLPEQDTLDTVIRAASGVFSGLALAGLLLLISRRIRHQKFPRSGGEILWVMGGIVWLAYWVIYLHDYVLLLRT